MAVAYSSVSVNGATIICRLTLTLLLISSIVLPAPVFTALAVGIYIWVTLLTDGPGNYQALSLATPFLALGAIGLLMSADNQQYEVLKDVWYVGKLSLCLAVGCLLGRREVDSSGIEPHIVFVGIFGSLLSLAIVPLLMLRGLIDEGNESAKILALVSLVAIPVLLERIRAAGAAFKFTDAAYLILILVAAIYSNSRITIVAAIILVIAWAGVLSSVRRTVIGGSVIALLGVLVWQLLPEYQGGEFNALTKMRRSFEEMALTDGYDSTAMIWNWRGFEAFNAQMMFDAGTLWQKLFGFGLGAEVNLGLVVQMSQDMALQYLPSLHNGFYYVLIKFGLFGLLVYAVTVFSWFRWKTLKGEAGFSLASRLLRGMVLVVLASTAVITGLFNKSELHGMTILIAYLLGFVSVWKAAPDAGLSAPRVPQARPLGAAA